MNIEKKLFFGVALAALSIGCLAKDEVSSGLQPGDGTTPFNPMHVTGADRGTQTCPV
jgi:hypothetical protein